VQIELKALLPSGHLGGRNDVGILNANEGLIEKRLSAVTFGKVEKKVPAERFARQKTDAIDLLLAGNFGTCG
jgi:hypothetical protein